MDTVLLQDSYHVGQNSVTPKSPKPAAQTSARLCLGQSRVNTCVIGGIDKGAPLWSLSNHCGLPAVIETDLVLLLWES